MNFFGHPASCQQADLLCPLIGDDREADGGKVLGVRAHDGAASSEVDSSADCRSGPACRERACQSDIRYSPPDPTICMEGVL